MSVGARFYQAFNSLADLIPRAWPEGTEQLHPEQVEARMRAGESFRLVAVSGEMMPRTSGRFPLILSVFLAEAREVDGEDVPVYGVELDGRRRKLFVFASQWLYLEQIESVRPS